VKVFDAIHDYGMTECRSGLLGAFSRHFFSQLLDKIIGRLAPVQILDNPHRQGRQFKSPVQVVIVKQDVIGTLPRSPPASIALTS